MNLKGRDFLKLLDFTDKEILHLIDVAEKLKYKKRNGINHFFLVSFAIILPSVYYLSLPLITSLSLNPFF